MSRPKDARHGTIDENKVSAGPPKLKVEKVKRGRNERLTNLKEFVKMFKRSRERQKNEDRLRTQCLAATPIWSLRTEQ